MSVAVPTAAAAAKTDVGTAVPTVVLGADWPRTSRLMPWSIAAFSAMLWLLPFDAIQLPISLPVDSKLDRFAIGGMLVLWLLVTLGAREVGPRRRPSLVGAAYVGWLAVILASIALHLAPLSQSDELTSSIRSLSLVLSFGVLFLMVATSLRPAEVRPLLRLNLVLACITAVGVIVQYRTGTNWFYKLADYVPGFQVGLPPDTTQENVRAQITGPTGHGLAVGTMLGMMVAYGLAEALESVGRRRVLYLVAVGLLFAGCVATQRKTAFLVPLAAMLVVAVYRPRSVLPLAPFAVVLVLGLQVAAPGSISGLRYQFSTSGSSNSTEGRTEDYAAVNPDVVSGLALGRGYGSYSALKYRFLDNQLLGLTITTGVLGLLAYIALVVAIALTAHRLARDGPGHLRTVGIAVAAAAPAYLIANALFDTLAFRGVTYLLLLLAGTAVAASASPSAEAVPTDGSGS